MGTLTIAVTDSPIDDASEVWIEFTGLNFYDSDGFKTEVTFDDPKRINLLSLQGSASEEILVEYPVQAGDYTYVTFNIDFDQSTIVTSEGLVSLESVLPDWDSFFQQLVLDDTVEPPIVPFSVAENMTTHLTFDFDLRKSIFDDGNSNIYSFSPAIRSVVTSESANISGSIDAGTYFNGTTCIAESSAIYAFSGSGKSLQDIRGTSGDPTTTSNITNTGSGYTYELGFLPAGDYTVAIACNASNDTPNQIDPMLFNGKQTITVTQGNSIYDANFL
jgi:hypothetical protein